MGMLGALSMVGVAAPGIVRAGGKGHVVVIGGGYAGAVAAKYVRMADPGIEVTVIEKDAKYY
ncbi:MAG: NAD(P)-binding protein, partial [Magnetococcales bacterium]|nr:NAD(P)-binding protein [Magnetococcales bacterium]